MTDDPTTKPCPSLACRGGKRFGEHHAITCHVCQGTGRVPKTTDELLDALQIVLPEGGLSWADPRDDVGFYVLRDIDDPHRGFWHAAKAYDALCAALREVTP